MSGRRGEAAATEADDAGSPSYRDFRLRSSGHFPRSAACWRGLGLRQVFRPDKCANGSLDRSVCSAVCLAVCLTVWQRAFHSKRLPLLRYWAARWLLSLLLPCGRIRRRHRRWMARHRLRLVKSRCTVRSCRRLSVTTTTRAHRPLRRATSAGAGRHGVVHLAYDETLDRKVAIKVMSGSAEGIAGPRARVAGSTEPGAGRTSQHRARLRSRTE